MPTYRVVDPDQHHLEVWTPDDTAPVVERERVTWRPEGADEELAVELGALFEPISGGEEDDGYGKKAREG